MFRARVVQFLQQCFPGRQSHTVLLDGETLLHTDDARAAMREHRVRLLPDWPPHSPDLNPQENVWSWAEAQLRKSEQKSDAFATFRRRIIHISQKYPAKGKLVKSMAGRVTKCIKHKGQNIGK